MRYLPHLAAKSIHHTIPRQDGASHENHASDHGTPNHHLRSTCYVEIKIPASAHEKKLL